MSLALIVAMDRNGVIGRDGDLPWRLSTDLRRFKQLTMGRHLLMGRVTWDSLGRALPGRTSVVVSRQPLELPEGVLLASSFAAAMQLASHDELPFVIGGAQIYALSLPHVTRLYLTRVDADVEGDTRFPEVDWSEWAVVEEQSLPASDRDDYAHTFQVLERRVAEKH